ncbi:MAG TPA: 50S ribosomal protein L10 [Candidatus Polarisedimenticolaceae bacterium]|nr:50S ribosomal protein L10 [Candidatus Polarisedimenticolaceae bacterium]
MQRSEKTNVVTTLTESFRGMPHVILTDYKGMTASQSTDLRRKIRAVGGSYRVLKNRLARRGSEGTAVAKIADKLRGTCGLAGHATDPVGLAKVLSDFAKDNPQLKLVACVVDAREVYGADGIKQLATLPGLPELRAQLLALVNTPATQLVRLLNTPAGQVARALDARREKLEGGAS